MIILVSVLMLCCHTPTVFPGCLTESHGSSGPEPERDVVCRSRATTLRIDWCNFKPPRSCLTPVHYCLHYLGVSVMVIHNTECHHHHRQTQSHRLTVTTITYFFYSFFQSSWPTLWSTELRTILDTELGLV